MSFNITNNENYSSIEELFDIFTPQILDTFEEYFLNFTEILIQTHQYTMIVKTLESKLSKTVREFLKIDQDKVNDSQSNTQLSYNLGQTQLSKINSTLREFLSHQTAFNFYNPKDIDILVFKSMSPQSGGLHHI